MIGQFRPISLCNIVYKIVSKIIANGLQLVLHKIIAPFQSAFVPGKSIQENSVMAHEIFHVLKKKRRGYHFLAIRVDIEKVYDRMEWSLILFALRCFGFHAAFIHWIEQCLVTSRSLFC